MTPSEFRQFLVNECYVSGLIKLIYRWDMPRQCMVRCSGKKNPAQKLHYGSWFNVTIHTIMPTRSTLQKISQQILLLAANVFPTLDSSGTCTLLWAGYIHATSLSLLQLSSKQRQLSHWPRAWDSVSGHDTATLSLLHQLLSQHLPGGSPTERKIIHWSVHPCPATRLPLHWDRLLGW